MRSLRDRVAGLFRANQPTPAPLHLANYAVCCRCGHGWYKRKEAPPARCPNQKCQSRKWNQPPSANPAPAEAGVQCP